MTITTLRCIGVKCNLIRIKNLIDDISLHVIGGPTQVADQATTGLTMLLRGMEDRRLPISWD
eukprot:1341119-Pyramimonas_sp.AAC.1